MSCIGGGLYYLAHSGRLSFRGTAVHKVEIPLAPPPTHLMILEPMLANLTDRGGDSYLRIAVTLRVGDATEKVSPTPKEEKSKDDKSMNQAVASVRDTLLTVLGAQTADDLLAADGKPRLKALLRTALAQHNSDLKVVDVYFTDFLVQR